MKNAKLQATDILQNLGLIVLLATTYFLCGKLGLQLAFLQANATAVWPPAGIALAALLIFGHRLWPGVYIGAFLVNLTTEGSLLTSLLIAAGNTLEAVVGAYLINKFANGLAAFEHPSTFLRFLTFGPILSTAISATVGVTSLMLAGFGLWENYLAVWLTWWLGDAVSLLVITPMLALFVISPPTSWNARFFEFMMLLVSALGLSYLVFGNALFPSVHYPLSFLVLPVLLWAAFRFAPPVTAAIAFVISAVAVWGTLQGYGPFVLLSPNASLVTLQAFIGISTISAYLTATVASDWKRTQSQLEEGGAHYKTFFEVSPDAILVHRGNRISFVNKACIKLLGARAPGELLGDSVYAVFPRGLNLDRAQHSKATLTRVDGKTVRVRMAVTPFAEHNLPAAHIIMHRLK